MNLKIFVFLFTIIIYLMSFGKITGFENSCLANPNCGACKYSECFLCWDSYLFNSKCISVETKLENCLTYKNSLNCLLCEFGYYLVAGKCKKISIPICLESENNIDCLVCEGLIKNGKCSKINCSDPGCRSCIIHENKEYCQFCDFGYSLNFSNLKCSLNSLNKGCWIIANGKCLMCHHGYYDDDNSLSASCKKKSEFNYEPQDEDKPQNPSTNTQDESKDEDEVITNKPENENTSGVCKGSSCNSRDCSQKFSCLSFMFAFFIIFVKNI